MARKVTSRRLVIFLQNIRKQKSSYFIPRPAKDISTLEKSIIPVWKKGEILASTEKDYQESLGVTYLPFLVFSNEKVYEQLARRTKKALLEKRIARNQQWLGHFFHTELTKKKLPDLSIHWIHEDIGFGVFTAVSLKKHTFIGEYTGKVRKHIPRKDQKNSYTFAYVIGEEEETGYTIDAKNYGNHTRFINHQLEGNCDALLILHNGIMKVILVTNKEVEEGEQLTYDYGADYWEKREDFCRF